MVFHVSSKEEFDRLLNNSPDKLVIIDFFAPWCGPCRMIGPKVDKLADEFPDCVFIKVDVDDAACEDIMDDYDIKVMPTFYLLKNGELKEQLEGNVYDKLRQAVMKYQ